jgi:hypothetical protein
MEDEPVRALDRILDSGDAAGALEFVISHARSTRNPSLLFEARLMKKRLELGLPLIQTEASSEFPRETRSAYDQAMIEAARDAGDLALEHGDIPGAWPYFRAIGEPSRVAAAIEKVRDNEGIETIIAIAFQEGVHPAKGLELILAQQGICRAITSFGMYPVQNGRAQCIALLVRHLHSEVLDRMGRAIESQEGVRPATGSIVDMLTGRDWLFGEYNCYVDTSHLHSMLPYCLEVTDREILQLFHELCEYGKRLSEMFQSRGQPPFEQPFVDYGHYIEALLGMNVDAHILHFREKVEQCDPDETGTAPAQLLVNLLVQLGRYEEAVEVSLRYLSDEPYELACPSVLRLCHLAGDYDRMREVARQKGDFLSYLAASVIGRERVETPEPVDA